MSGNHHFDARALVGGGGFLSPPRTWYAIVLYCALVGAVLAAKPAFAFREDGSLREFGCGPGKSVFSFGTVAAASAIGSGFFFATADLVASS
jgi:hypothetical protein